jgi:hypothetical protein
MQAILAGGAEAQPRICWRCWDTSTNKYDMQPYMQQVLINKRRAAKLRESVHRFGVEVAHTAWGSQRRRPRQPRAERHGSL